MKYLEDNDQSLIPLYSKVIPKLNGKFREAQKFRPFRILLQIVTFQLAFWVTLLMMQLPIITAISAILFKLHRYEAVLWPNLALLFSLEKYSIRSIEGMLNCSNFIISSLISAYYLKFIIERSKLCLDFCITCFLIHLIVTSIYNLQFPLNFVWWTVVVASAWLMTERSRSICLKKELIPISLKPRQSPKSDKSPNLDSHQQQSCWFNSFFNKFYWMKIKRTSNSTININSSQIPLNC